MPSAIDTFRPPRHYLLEMPLSCNLPLGICQSNALGGYLHALQRASTRFRTLLDPSCEHAEGCEIKWKIFPILQICILLFLQSFIYI